MNGNTDEAGEIDIVKIESTNIRGIVHRGDILQRQRRNDQRRITRNDDLESIIDARVERNVVAILIDQGQRHRRGQIRRQGGFRRAGEGQRFDGGLDEEEEDEDEERREKNELAGNDEVKDREADSIARENEAEHCQSVEFLCSTTILRIMFPAT